MNFRESMNRYKSLLTEQTNPGGVADGYYRNVVGFDCSQTYQVTYGNLAFQPIPKKVNGTQLTTPFSNVTTGECMHLTLPNGNPFDWNNAGGPSLGGQPYLIDFNNDFYSIVMYSTTSGQCSSVVTATVVNGGGSNIYDPNGPTCATTPSSGCDPAAWSNHANWTSTFTNTVSNLAANPNPNQPCTFLNGKIAQFTNQIPTVGPVWANQLQCKLDLCNQLHTQYNC